jgi:hypothetical protein
MSLMELVWKSVIQSRIKKWLEKKMSHRSQKEFHIRSSLICPYSDLSAPKKQLNVMEVNFRSEKIQAFS